MGKLFVLVVEGYEVEMAGKKSVVFSSHFQHGQSQVNNISRQCIIVLLVLRILSSNVTNERLGRDGYG